MDIELFFREQKILNDKELITLSKFIHRKSFSKKELILPVENTSKQIYFIETGIARVFYAKKDKDITLHFLQENMVGFPIDSIFYNQICKFGIEALTESTVAIVAYEHWENLAKNNNLAQEFISKRTVEYLKKANDRIYNLKFQTPKERYETMLL